MNPQKRIWPTQNRSRRKQLKSGYTRPKTELKFPHKKGQTSFKTDFLTYYYAFLNFFTDPSSKHIKNAFRYGMRKPRKLLEDARYHVTARTVHKRLLIENPEVKEMFLEVLERAKSKFTFKIDNFVLMNNHFHLIIQPGKSTSLSTIMKWILQTFAIRYNKANKLWGHFWGGRFFSSIIPNFKEYLRIFVYIDQNPVIVNLVKKAEDWLWGALSFRRRGCKKIIDDDMPWLQLCFPRHKQLLLT